MNKEIGRPFSNGGMRKKMDVALKELYLKSDKVETSKPFLLNPKNVDLPLSEAIQARSVSVNDLDRHGITSVNRDELKHCSDSELTPEGASPFLNDTGELFYGFQHGNDKIQGDSNESCPIEIEEPTESTPVFNNTAKQKQKIHSINEALKQQMGSDKYNEVNQKFDTIFVASEELKTMLKNQNIPEDFDFNTLDAGTKSVLVTLADIVSDSSLDNKHVRYPFTVLCLAIIAIIVCGSNQYVLASPDAKITYQEILASQYTTLLTILNIIVTTNNLSKSFDYYVDKYNKQNGLEPSDYLYVNVGRLLKYAGRDFLDASKLGKVRKSFLYCLALASPVAAYYSANTDYIYAMKGLRKFAEKKLGISNDYILTLFEKFGAMNLVLAITLASKLCYNTGKRLSDAIKNILVDSVKICRGESPTLEEKAPSRKQEIISNIIIDTLSEATTEGKTEDEIISQIKERVLAELKYYDKQKVITILIDILKKELNIQDNPPNRLSRLARLTKNSVDLGLTIVMLLAGERFFSATFGGTGAAAQALERVNLNKDTNNNYLIPLNNNENVACADFLDCADKIDFADIPLTNEDRSSIDQVMKINDVANAIQGPLFADDFFHAMARIFFLLVSLIKHPQISSKKVIKKLKEYDPRVIKNLPKIHVTAGVYSYVGSSTIFYMKNIIATAPGVKSYGQLQGDQFTADYSFQITIGVAAILSVFAGYGMYHGPEVIMQIPEIIKGSFNSIKNAIKFIARASTCLASETAKGATYIANSTTHGISQFANFFRSSQQPIQSRNIENIELETI